MSVAREHKRPGETDGALGKGGSRSGRRLLTKLMLRLLPVQILLAAIGSVNGIVSGLFASNYVGVDAMSAVGLYAPVNQLLMAVNLMLVGGSQILCGKYLGRSERERTNRVFSADLMIAAGFGCLVILVILGVVGADLTRVIVRDPAVRPLFNLYCAGQAVGILPLMLGQQAAAFLSLENRVRRTTAASLVFIAVNLILNYLFVVVMEMGCFGLALASSIGLWAFFLIQAQYFVSGKSMLRFSLKGVGPADAGDVVRTGLPGSLSQGYNTMRRFIVNALVLAFVGTAGISAFAASDMFLGIVWSVPTGMMTVSRMLMSISIGEEDRKTLADIMRVMFRRFIPIMTAIALIIAVCAIPLTSLFYHDPSDPVYGMTVWGFRLLPLCMPFSLIYMHFVCYGQASGKQIFVHVMSALDGVVCVAGFSALLVPLIGICGVYTANILNGLVTTIAIIGYAWHKGHGFPRTMDELMVIPEDFGVPEENRIDISVRNAQEVVSVSEAVQTFCLARGIDDRRSMIAGLCMEEMAGNVVEHGFTKDRRDHTADIRVVLIRKPDPAAEPGASEAAVLLRIRDDCVRFDPEERMRSAGGGESPLKNIGIRMAYSMAGSVGYQSILGLNVLTMRI